MHCYIFTVTYMENALEYQKEIGNVKDTLRDLRHERDALLKQIETLSARFQQKSEWTFSVDL
jgi:uncharacterized coiled-coil DUF342 family protein